MGQIYNSASRVLAWLGPGDYSVSFDRAKKLFDYCKLNLYQDLKMRYNGYLANNLVEMSSTLLNRTQCEVLQLLCNPWISRLWLLPEVALAVEEPLMCSGSSTVKMNALLLLWTLATERDPNDVIVYRFQTQAHQM